MGQGNLVFADGAESGAGAALGGKETGGHLAWNLSRNRSAGLRLGVVADGERPAAGPEAGAPQRWGRGARAVRRKPIANDWFGARFPLTWRPVLHMSNPEPIAVGLH